MLQEMVLMVTPGATCSARPIVPVSPSRVDGGGEQASSAADRKLETRIAVRGLLRSVRMGGPPDGFGRNVGIMWTEGRTRAPRACTESCCWTAPTASCGLDRTADWTCDRRGEQMFQR